MRCLIALLPICLPCAGLADETQEKLRDCIEYHAFSMADFSDSMEEVARVVVKAMCHEEVLAYAAGNNVDGQYGLPSMEDELVRGAINFVGEKRMHDRGTKLYDHAPSYRWRAE